MDDVDLVADILKGLESSREVFVRRLSPRIRCACVTVMGATHSDLDDVIQEVLLKCLDKVSLWNGTSTLANWVYVVAANHAKNYVRRADPLYLDEIALERAVDPKVSAEVKLCELELASLALDFIHALPKRQQTVLVLKLLQDKRFKEIAAELNCPYDTAKANYRHGVMKLRAYLEAQGVS